MKTYGEVKIWLHTVSYSIIGVKEWSATRHVRFTSRLPAVYETGWTSKPVWTRWRRKSFITVPAWNRAPVFQPI